METAPKKHSDPLTYYLRIVASAAIVVAAWGMLLLLTWNLDRGFDLTDEAHLLYYYRHPDAFLDDVYLQYFRLVRALIPPALDHIYYYRLFKLIALVALTGIFSALFVKWIDRRIPFINGFVLNPIVLFHFLLIGSFLAYCHGSQTLSYNDLVTLCLLFVAAACLALDLAPFKINVFVWKFVVSVLIGATIVLLIPIKWPCAPLLTGYYLLFTTQVCSNRSRHALVASFGGAIFGAVLLVFTISDIGIGTTISYSNLFRAVSDQNNWDIHEPSELMKMYVVSTFGRILELLRSPSTVALLVLPFAAICRRLLLSSRGSPRAVAFS